MPAPDAISVFYDDDCDALWVSTRPDPFMPGTLVAEQSGDTLIIRRCVGPNIVAGVTFDRIMREDGTGFPDAPSALAYLQGEFAKRRAVGDLYAVQVDISAPGQTVISLQQPPSLLSTLRVEVNGIVYRPPEIVVSDVAVTWANPAFVLEPTDRVTLVYS